FFDVDPTIIRVLWVVGARIVPPMTVASALILYVALAFIVPPDPAES
ncbi:MAG: PspC domain-containing protein, partial [Chloroflexi bacterium]|nr:PspC domain-containing protein [Chloroflexota bacterium]